EAAGKGSSGALFGPPRQHPSGAREVAGVAVGVGGQVVLVLRLRLPEGTFGLDRGDGFAWPETGGIHIGDGLARDLLLLRAEREDRRAVAGTDVVALAVEGGRVVDLEEERQDVAERRRCRIEDDLERLGVTGVIAVGRVVVVAAGVTDAGGEHAGLAADEVFHAPEAASSQD